MATEHISKRGVLIAGHSQHTLSLVADMLRVLKRRDIREVTNATMAMIELRRRVFEVMIIDDDLAGMDAVAFVKQLRSCTKCVNRLTPIIMMSGAPDVERIAAARDAGVTEFLRKPFAANHLQVRLTSIQANPRDFIEAPAFVGPDRRRRTAEYAGDERRDEPAAPKAKAKAG